MTNHFWKYLDTLIQTSTIVIDRPKDSAHPRFPNIIYPLDYGYLDNTSGGDGEGIDIWRGTLSGDSQLVAVVATVDIYKRDAELKLLLNCTEAEIEVVFNFLLANQIGAYLIHRQP